MDMVDIRCLRVAAPTLKYTPCMSIRLHPHWDIPPVWVYAFTLTEIYPLYEYTPSPSLRYVQYADYVHWVQYVQYVQCGQYVQYVQYGQYILYGQYVQYVQYGQYGQYILYGQYVQYDQYVLYVLYGQYVL
jgi:hypothetical protein